MFSTANGVMFCEIYLQSAAHIITDPRFIYLFFCKFFLTDPRSLIPRSSILNPNFPVNLEVLLINFFFRPLTWSVVPKKSTLSAIEFLDQPIPEKLDMGFIFYGYEMLQVECADSQVQSYPYKHIRDTYVTSGWISNDAFLAPHRLILNEFEFAVDCSWSKR